jgi:hypothetical protein
MSAQPEVIAFVAVERVKGGRGMFKDKRLSRRYHAREAAEEFAALVRKDGRDAFVQPVMGAPA